MMNTYSNKTLFALGQVVVTQGISAILAIPQNTTDLRQLIAQHIKGQWGDVCDADKHANDQALMQGGRLMSAYQLADERIWIITEADRSVTTVLLPSEY
ncbi:MAG: hypothetical protein ACRDCT_31470 [Shewanella sp.]